MIAIVQNTVWICLFLYVLNVIILTTNSVVHSPSGSADLYTEGTDYTVVHCTVWCFADQCKVLYATLH